MSTTRFAVILGTFAIIVVLVLVLLSNLDDQFVYSNARLGLQVIGTVAILAILLQAIRRVRILSHSPEQRLRMVAIVFILAIVTIGLTITALLHYNEPPPQDLAAATIGIALSAVLAFGLTIIALTEANDPNDD